MVSAFASFRNRQSLLFENESLLTLATGLAAASCLSPQLDTQRDVSACIKCLEPAQGDWQ
jgi:hypothetical protein